MEKNLCPLRFLDTEKSIWVQRPGVGNTFLRDRQTCVIMIRGLFVRESNSDLSLSRVRKRGIRTKMSVGNRCIDCSIDSSERSFGSTFVSNELLTAVTCRCSRESVRTAGGIDFGTPLQPSHHRTDRFYPFRVNSLPIYLG